MLEGVNKEGLVYLLERQADNANEVISDREKVVALNMVLENYRLLVTELLWN